jgi:hypothetical protein
MAGSFTNNGDGTVTIKFEYTATIAKIQGVADNAIEELHDRGYRDGWPLDQDIIGDDKRILPGDLTNTQKISIMDAYTRQIWVNMARSRDKEERVDVAKSEADAAAGDIDLS